MDGKPFRVFFIGVAFLFCAKLTDALSEIMLKNITLSLQPPGAIDFAMWRDYNECIVTQAFA
jgi:hypothetical protein